MVVASRFGAAWLWVLGLRGSVAWGFRGCRVQEFKGLRFGGSGFRGVRLRGLGLRGSLKSSSEVSGLGFRVM